MRNFGFIWAPLLLSVFALDSSAQTIADIARRERSRQHNVQSTVTITSGTTTATAASTSGSSTVPAEAPGQNAQNAQSATAKPTGPTDNKGHDEKYWRNNFQKARDDVKRADDKVQVLEAKLKDLNLQMLRQSDVYNREYRLNAEIATAQADLDKARKDAEQARQKITDLEEELRRSNGPAGWAR
jgi:predicted RNase H-like nuclease (RuvC/YqgF family)